MIIVRHYSERDLERVKALHAAQGLQYVLPDLEADTMLVRTVVEEDGLVTNAAFLRKTAEAFWLFDPQAGWRRERLGRLMLLHNELTKLARHAGFEDVHAWLPPAILSKTVHQTFLRLGWAKQEWTCYQHEVT